MDGAAAIAGARRRSPWVEAIATVAAIAVLLALLVALFPWDWLRGPLNRYVSERTGRHFEITRKLDIKLGRTIRIIADGIEVANPAWASDPYLVQAEGAQIRIELLSLLRRPIELPLIELHQLRLGLQVQADGRRSWALGDTADFHDLPAIGALVVDRGSVHFIAAHHGADIRTDFEIEAAIGPRIAHASGSTATDGASAGTSAAAPAMPLAFESTGTWQHQPFAARGRAGNLLYLGAAPQRAFPLEVSATAGTIALHAGGSVSSLATLEAADAVFDLQGSDLAELYKFVGMALPASPRYSLHGNLSKRGAVWHVRQIEGKLGNSDLNGELAFDRTRKVPLLAGRVQSGWLDLADLAPLVGLPQQPPGAAVPVLAGRPEQVGRAGRDRGKLLPAAELDPARLKAMDADLRYTAGRIGHVQALPLERLSVHVRLKDGVLQLDPVNLAVAGGSVAARLQVDGNSDPALAQVHLDARSLEFGQLLPDLAPMRASFGTVHGGVDLEGRGNSVARMLGTSSGTIAVLMGRGRIGNSLLEVAAAAPAKIVRFVMGGQQNVTLRCAAALFDVNHGLMSSRALVLDTGDTVIYGSARVSLASEAIDLRLHPYPKDTSMLALHPPLRVAGTFAGPRVGLDEDAMAGSAGRAPPLAAINPLLALAAAADTGLGQNADCGPALREAASPYAAARITALSQPRQASVLGGPPAAAGAPAGPARLSITEGREGDSGSADERTAQAPQPRRHVPAASSELYGP